MPELDPLDSERGLRTAFECFRSDALDSVPVPGPASVRDAARRRRRHRIAVAGCAAVALLATGGAGVIALTNDGSGPHRTTAAPGTTREGTASATSDPAGIPGPPSPGSSTGPDHPPQQRARVVALHLDHDPVPLPSQSHGVYQGPLSMTIRNTGHAPITLATVELTIPTMMSFTVNGGAACDAGPCIVRQIHDLAPGATQTVTGTLSYGTGSPQRRREPIDRAAVRVTTTDHNGAQAVESHSFSVTLGNESTPSPDPSGTLSPSASPSTASHGADDGDGDGQEGSAPPPDSGGVQASPTA